MTSATAPNDAFPSSGSERPRGLWRAVLLGSLLAAWLAAAPVLALLGGMLAFGFIPGSFAFFSLVPQAGSLPAGLTGLILCLAAFFLEACVIFPVWRMTHRRPGWETEHAATGGLLLTAFYLLGWGLAGLPFPEQSVWPFLLRLLLAAPALGWIFRPLSSLAPASFARRHASTLPLALGAAAILLLPWMIQGALGTVRETLSALVTALAYGVGEELLLRGVVAALIARAAGRPRLGFLLGILIGLAMQTGYILPQGDWISALRLFNTVAVGVLATELAVRGSLGSAILVHTAFEFGFPGWVDPRMEFSLPHPAALESVGLVYLTGIAFALVRILGGRILKRQPPPLRLSVSAGFAFLALAGSAAGYAAKGNPGFTEDGFLIILREQADVSAAASIADRGQRIEYVYRTLAETAETTQAPLRAELERLGARYQPHYLINLIEVYGRADGMTAFASRPEVREVIVNPNVRTVNYNETMDLLVLPIPGQGIEWNITATGAPLVWQAGADGRGIVVAGADTGVDWTHPALQSNYRGWSNGAAAHDYHWYDPWDDSAAPWDDLGHGTYTLGTAVGRDGEENQIGMAPGAQWIACRNMRYGLGNPGKYLSCMEFFLAPFPHGGDPFRDGRPDLAPHVVNNSWSCPAREGCGADTLAAALRNLRLAGIMMVAAAGNEGPACATAGDPPANSGDVFTVGASDENDSLAFFSSRGPSGSLVKPDITAPGWMVRSCIPGGLYSISAGTSIAAPHVTGAVALLWSAFPELVGQIERTEEILRSSAHPVAAGQFCGFLESRGTECLCGADTKSGIPNNSYGYGMLRVDTAFSKVLS
ncbi:MAG: S8 family serine peptidase [Anaerolineales bacterium]|nr:S8 family serine peptidase [Anaerolineales bacterium]